MEVTIPIEEEICPNSESNQATAPLSQVGSKRKRQRQENSLGELTKLFVKYVIEKGCDKINVNEMVKKLRVKKRRIYDITNVLEGIGYVKKMAKNQIKWLKKEYLQGKIPEMEGEVPTITERITGTPIKKPHQKRKKSEYFTMKRSKDRKAIQRERMIRQLGSETQLLENMNKYMEENIKALRNDPENKKYNYITADDMLLIIKKDITNLIAVKGPKNMEIIDNGVTKVKGNTEEDEVLIETEKPIEETPPTNCPLKTQILIKSDDGEISLYKVEKDTGEFKKLEEENFSNGIAIVPSPFLTTTQDKFGYTVVGDESNMNKTLFQSFQEQKEGDLSRLFNSCMELHIKNENILNGGQN